ncbi:interaptin isoform X2 [Hyalella azteca]|uniref:Interaptin isoform X2 n=1 Tax=Hyalella azteca TaxID=294128 RepID=A0A8B7NRM3_HYAAZ|nr:interaptin isoform X2 [Hyalella azteca]
MTSKTTTKAGRHSLYGNQHGLPGLPKTSYITRKPIRQTPRLPPQPPPTARAPPRPPTMMPPPPQPPLMPAGPDPFVTRRMDMLEQRLNSSEQSNRALMDEIMRLQQDMKIQIKKNEMGLGDERESKTRLEIAVRQAQGHQFETDDRVRRCEEGVKENRMTIQQLSGHIQGVEKLAHAIQHENSDKSNISNSKTQEYQRELLKLSQNSEQLERLCSSLREDNRSLQSQLETVKRDLASLQSNVKLQARLLEDNAKAPKEPLKGNNDTAKMNETERLVIEGKIISLNNAIQDLSARLSSEAKKRDKVEVNVNERVNALTEEYGATKRQKDKELQDLEEKLKELQAGFSVSEKQKILTEISTVANDLQRKMDQRNKKLREDTVSKLEVIENTLISENKRRQAEEQKLREEIEIKIKEMEMREQGSSKDLKTVFDKHNNDTIERISDLSKRMNKAEEVLRTHKLEHERVLSAEINERQREDKVLDGKIEDLEHRLAMGLTNLQSSIGEAKMAGKVPKDGKSSTVAAAPAASHDSDDKMKELAKLQADNERSIREQLAQEVGHLDQRLQKVEKNMNQQNEKIDNQLKSAEANEKEAKDLMGSKIQTQIDKIEFQQKKTDKQVEDLKNKVQDTPKGLQEIKTDIGNLENKLSEKLDKETRERKLADEEMRDDIDRIIGQRDVTVPSLAQLQSDVDATQTGMKKLAEAVHVVKTSLMERVKDEKKLREQETTILRRDVERLDTKYHDIKERIRAGDNFEADDDDFP